MAGAGGAIVNDLTGAVAPALTLPDVLTGGAVLTVLTAVGGAVAWVARRADRREDGRRSDREYWTDVLGIRQLAEQHRQDMHDLAVQHRREVAQLRDEHRNHIDTLRGRIARQEQRQRRGSVKHQAWDDKTRADLIALGARDPGPPPPIYDTDDPPEGQWYDEQPADRPHSPLRVRRDRPLPHDLDAPPP